MPSLQLLGVCPIRKVSYVIFLPKCRVINTLVLQLAHGLASRKSWKTQVEMTRAPASATYMRLCSRVLLRGVGLGSQISNNKLYNQVKLVKEHSLNWLTVCRTIRNVMY